MLHIFFKYKRRLLEEPAKTFFEVLRWDMNLMQSLSPPAIGRLSKIDVATHVIAVGLDHPDNLKVVDKLASDIKGGKEGRNSRIRPNDEFRSPAKV